MKTDASNNCTMSVQPQHQCYEWREKKMGRANYEQIKTMQINGKLN